MANITVNLEVDSEQFEKFCVDNINDLPKEKMEELLLKAVEVALIADKEKPYYQDSNILVVRNKDSWGNIKYEPTPLMEKILKNIDTEKYLKPIVDEICNYISEHYKELVQKYITDAFAKLLFTQTKEYEIKSFVYNEINNRSK